MCACMHVYMDTCVCTYTVMTSEKETTWLSKIWK